MSELFSSIGFIALAVFVIAALASSIVIVPERHLKFISLLGKYQKTTTPGLNFKIPFLTKVDATVYTGRDSKNVELRLKTKDQMTFDMQIQIQYEISSRVSDAYKAVYNIEDYLREMAIVATDCAISAANKLEIEDIFDRKEEITDKVDDSLKEYFGEFGITIKKVYSDEPRLPDTIERANNRLLEAKRELQAAEDEANAIKVKKVGEAEADGESVKIRMERLGESRKEYAERTSESIDILKKTGATAKEAMDFLNGIGEQDAMVSSARHGSTIIFHDSNKGSSSADALLAKSISGEKDKTEVAKPE